MARSASEFNQLQKAALATLMAGAILTLLIFGRGFLVPIVLAALLAMLITSAIVRLEKLGLPTWLATTCSIGISLVCLIFIGMIFQNQAGALAGVWPQYSKRLDEIVASLTVLIGADMVEYIQASIAKIDFGKPVADLASSAGGFFGSVVLVLMYTAFLLAERGTMTPKMSLLVPNSRENADLKEIFSAVSHGIRRYLTIKVATSLVTGSLCYAVLKFHGVYLAELWGLLIFLLNFIPTVGSIIAVIIPSVLSLIQFDTIWPFVQITALLGLIQFMVGNVIEPRFMGHTLNLSPFVVIVSLTFWGTVWGIEGAFLSVPITASLVIICRNISQLRWIAILLSVDGQTNAPEEPSLPQFHLPWLKSTPPAESAEIAALRKELKDMKAKAAKAPVKSATARPRRRRKANDANKT